MRGCGSTSLVVALAVAAIFCCCLTVRCQTGVRTVRVAVQHNETFQFLSAGNFSSSVSFNFSLLELNETLLMPQNAKLLHDSLIGQQAVVADYHITLAVATYSLAIPYFITNKFDFSDMEYRRNMFKFEIDYRHLNMTLYDVSRAVNKDSFIILSDASRASEFFVDSMAGKVLVHRIISENTTDAEIYSFLSAEAEHLDNRCWVLLFVPENFNQIERIFNQTGLAGRLQPDDYFFIPNLEDNQEYLEIIRLSEAIVYTFELQGDHRLNEQQLHQAFLTDCFRHFAAATDRQARIGRSNYTALDALYDTSTVGISGPFAYRTGRRTSVRLNVMSIGKSRPPSDFLQVAGTWQQDAAEPYQINYDNQAGIKNSMIRFAAIMENPYIYRNDYGELTGLGIEIIELMKAKLQFRYTIEFVDDGLYGGKLDNGSWTGIMKYLTQNRADISVNFMATTAVRLQDVDLSVNLMESGIQMLVKREIHHLDFFHVFYPFSWFVWLSILFSMFILAGTLWISDKISPNVKGKSIFSMMESFFLVFSSFLMSKVETEPRKPSARLFTLLLWFSTLVYMTTYVSNLVAFLVKPDDSLPFNSIAELENATSYRYVFMSGGATYATAQNKWPQLVQRAKANWPNEMLYASVDASVQKVLNSDRYVFVESAATLRFQKTKHCNLRLYGNVEEVVFETMLIRRGFKYTDQVREFLRTLRFNEFPKLERKYFDINRCPTGIINPDDKKPLGFNYFAGLFALVGVGAVLGFLYILLHWLFKRVYEAVSRSRSKRLKYGEEYDSEIVKVIKDGIWVSIKGRRQFYFIANNSLSPDPTKIRNAKTLGLHPGDTMRVQYFGKDAATQSRIFARLNEENQWYQDRMNTKDESDSESA